MGAARRGLLVELGIVLAPVGLELRLPQALLLGGLPLLLGVEKGAQALDLEFGR